MTGYRLVNLIDLLEEVGEDETKRILSTFSCPLNKDVEFFLREKAIPFSKMGQSITHLVYASYKKIPVLVAYFALAYKTISIPREFAGKSGSNFRRRVNRFARYEPSIEAYTMAAPLIAQLGKNYANGYNNLISGGELLNAACEKIYGVQYNVGGRFAYLECEENEKLISFYEDNGFIAFNTRPLDRDESDIIAGKYLVQMIKYIKKGK